MKEYKLIQQRLAKGWNTFETRSLLSHMLLPEALSIRMGLKDYGSGQCLTEGLVGRSNEKDYSFEKIFPGYHAYDGSYTELRIEWRGINLLFQTAHADQDWVCLITPLEYPHYPPTVVADVAILYNRPGYVFYNNGHIDAVFEDKTIPIFADGLIRTEPNYPARGPHLCLCLKEKGSFSTGKQRSVAEVEAIIQKARSDFEKTRDKYGDLKELYDAMQTVLAWDTIYEPKRDRVCSPVSRLWNVRWGGYVLFEWDTFFAGWMASLDNEDLAIANMVEMIHEKCESGCIPSFASDEETRTSGRSQPPLGAISVWYLYQKCGYKWLLEEVYEDLFSWNRWWLEHRQITPDHLTFGSEPWDSPTCHRNEICHLDEFYGSGLESGMDNSPMYEDVPYDMEKHMIKQADIGLMSLYCADCQALSNMANVLGKTEDVALLLSTKAIFEKSIQAMWNEEDGIFENVRTDTGKFSSRISPTSFYPMIVKLASEDQVESMMQKYFWNPDKFYGEYIIPTCTRDDELYHLQDYWQGRIWPPTNFLTYLGLCNYPSQDKARKELVTRSANLLLKEWRTERHIHENFNGTTGEGCDGSSSDRFYHWGALLALMSLIDNGFARSFEL